MCNLPLGLRYLQLHPAAVSFPAKLLVFLAFVSFPQGLAYLNNTPPCGLLGGLRAVSLYILVVQKLV